MPSSADDAFSRAVDLVLERVVDGLATLTAAVPRIVVDGRSGSGKTTLAARLHDAWPLTGELRVVALDDLYPGWDGLSAGTAIVADDILAPLAAARPGTFQRWDWSSDAPGERVVVDPDEPLIIEGAGALSAKAVRLAALSIWLDGPVTTRRARAIGRDGQAYAPHWERWAVQERAHMAAHDPAAIADLAFDLP